MARSLAPVLLAAWFCQIPFARTMRAQEQAPAATADANAPEISTAEEEPTFGTRVDFVMVPVVVRDNAGRTIGDLTQGDFALTDNGKRQTISRFSAEHSTRPPPKTDEGKALGAAISAADDAEAEDGEDESAPAAPPAVAERFIAYVFDDIHIRIGDLQQVQNAAQRHFGETRDAAARFGIFTTSGRYTLDFTDNLDEIEKALFRIQQRANNLPGDNCPDISYFQADLMLHKLSRIAIDDAISETLTCPDFRFLPAGYDPNSVYQQAERLSMNVAQTVVSLSGGDTRLALGVLRNVIRRLSAMPGARSLVLVSPGFLVMEQVRESTDVMNRAIRAQVTLNTLDPRGLYNATPAADAGQSYGNTAGAIGRLFAGQDAQPPADFSRGPMAKTYYLVESAEAAGDVLAELAEGTGGTLFRNNNDLRGGLRRMADRPEHHYVLGFSPRDLQLDGKFHNLKVSVTSRPGATVQARRGYYAPTHLEDAAEQARQEIETTLFSRDERADIPVVLNTQFFKSDDVNARLSVVAQVDLRALRFRKAGERSRNKLTVLSGVFDQDGKYVTGVQKIIDMNLRDQTLQTVRNAGISVKTSFDLTPGTYMVRLVVRDAEGELMAARTAAVEIPY